MMLVLVVIAWAMVLGASPGLALIAVSLTLLAVDQLDPTFIDRMRRRATE